MSYKQIVDWCRDNDVWYLKMDIEIPEVCMKKHRLYTMRGSL